MKAVIFDMDGLMIDSEPYWEQGDAAFFAKHGKKHSVEINRQVMGMGHREIMEMWKKEFGFEGDTDTLIAERKGMFYEHFLPHIAPMEGLDALVHTCHAKGLLLAVATSGHTREKTKEILRRLSLDSMFTVVVSGDDVKKSKPAPDIYLITAKELGVEPRDCLVLEDSPTGVKAGKAAEMTMYGVNKDPELAKKLEEAGADEVFKSLSEIDTGFPPFRQRRIRLGRTRE